MTTLPPSPPVAPGALPDGGALGRLIREHDWSRTPLGPRHSWPETLRAHVAVVLAAKQPMFLGWGRELISLYNDAYQPLLGDKHPGALGTPLSQVFGADAYPALKPVFDALLDRGEPYAAESALVPLQRHGFLEDCYFDFGYTPVYGPHGEMQGMFVVCSEVTERVLSERRTRVLGTLASQLGTARTPGDVAQGVRAALADDAADLPLLLLLLPGPPAPQGPEQLALSLGVGWPEAQALSEQLAGPLGRGEARVLPMEVAGVSEVLAAPLTGPGETTRLGSLLIGVNPRRPLDGPYRDFLRVFSAQVAAALHRVRALEQERVHARQLELQNLELSARTRALEEFAALTHDLTLQGEPQALIRRALAMALSLLPPGYAAFWQASGGRWRVTELVGDVGSADLAAVIESGLPVGQSPTLDQPAQTREPLFQDVYPQGLDTPAEVVRHVNAVATLPVLVGGKVLGLFNVPLFEQRHWSAADRAVLVTTVRSLGLALESAQGLATLAEERRKLAAANQELEAFAYSVSHDLRAPVRHISGFNSLLRTALAGRLDAKTERYLKIVDDSASRMNALIDAMLSLARQARDPLHLGPVDLGQLVTQARQDLNPEHLGRGVQWHVSPLPQVRGDVDTLRQVVVNLLSNALKYSQGHPAPAIHIWAEERSQEWAVYVRDNGAGFDPRYAGKLFQAFQRLHQQDDFEGVGIGLANVRRIIQRHGGEVSAEGQPGQGATFSFTLPKDRPA